MVLLQRGTTRLAGRVGIGKNENIPLHRNTVKSRFYIVYICGVHGVQAVYFRFWRSLLYGRVAVYLYSPPHFIDC